MTERWFRFEFNNGDELLVDLKTVEIKTVGKGKIVLKEAQGMTASLDQGCPKRDTPYWAQLGETLVVLNITESCYKALIRYLVRGY